MITCSRCQQPVDSKAIACPFCQAPLKAFGHPGMPLYQKTGEGFLCDQCFYHEDDTCNFPHRPYAKTCILFKDKSENFQQAQDTKHKKNQTLKAWFQKNKGFLLLLTLILISLLWVLT